MHPHIVGFLRKQDLYCNRSVLFVRS